MKNASPFRWRTAANCEVPDAGQKAAKKMRDLAPWIMLLAFLTVSIGSLLAGLKGWHNKAQILLGLCGASAFGLDLYDRALRRQVGYPLHNYALSDLKFMLAGILVGIFVTLWLEGSLNVFTFLKERQNANRETGDSLSPFFHARLPRSPSLYGTTTGRVLKLSVVLMQVG